MLGNLGIKHVRLGFDGAGNGRHEDWYSGTPRPVDTLTRRDGAKLRERTRDLLWHAHLHSVEVLAARTFPP